MSLRNIGIVYRKELMDSLRERRTLISMIVMPLLLIPLLTVGFGVVAVKLISEAERQIPRVMVLGGEDSPGVMARLRALKTISIVPPRPDYVDLISNKKIRAAVEIPRGFEQALARGEAADVKVYVYEGDFRSSSASRRVQTFFRDLREQTVRERLQAHQLSAGLLKPFEITEKNVVSEEKIWGAIFGGFLTYIIVVMCMNGAMYPAMDLTAGEKERGTIETILCSPVPRTHLVLGKFLTVLTISLATACLAIFSIGMTSLGARALAGGLSPESPTMLRVAMSPKAAAAVLVMMLPIAVLFSAGQLAIALFAKSFREAQSYMTPLTMVIILLAVVSMLPGIELNAKLAMLPIVNTGLVSKEILTGTYHWNYILLIFASSCVYAAAALGVAVKLFQREDVLFRT